MKRAGDPPALFVVIGGKQTWRVGTRHYGTGWDCSTHPWVEPLRAVRCGASLRLSEFVPDEFVEPVGSHPRRHHQKSKTPHEGAFCFSGGEGGIRTHGTLTRTPDFESGTFDHSATSPKAVRVVHASRQSYADCGVLTTGFVIGAAAIYCRATPQRSPRGR